MKQIWIGLAIIAPVAVFAGVYQSYGLTVSGPPPPEYDFSSWSPTPAELQKALPPVGSLVQRRQAFRTMFQDRYRKHEPGCAVGLEFAPKNIIILKCPARLEPWNMDHLATQAWREARADFGRPYDIDIYYTFIAHKLIKIGELRTAPDVTVKGPQARIVYDFAPIIRLESADPSRVLRRGRIRRD